MTAARVGFNAGLIVWELLWFVFALALLRGASRFLFSAFFIVAASLTIGFFVGNVANGIHP